MLEMDIQTARHDVDTQTDGQTDREIDRQTTDGQQMDRQTARQFKFHVGSKCLPSWRAHLHEAGRLGQLRGPIGDEGGGQALSGNIPQQ